MENGRIEPLRALPVHREAQPYPSGPNIRHAHIFSDLLGGPPWRVLGPSCSKSAGGALRQGGRLGTPQNLALKGLLTPSNPWRCGCWEPPQNLAWPGGFLAPCKNGPGGPEASGGPGAAGCRARACVCGRVWRPWLEAPANPPAAAPSFS